MTGASWDHWFDVQYDLCLAVDELIDNAIQAGGESPTFRAALESALIEHLAERMRSFFVLPGNNAGDTDGGRDEVR